MDEATDTKREREQRMRKMIGASDYTQPGDALWYIITMF
jgi:hypothetical protein